MEIREYRVDRLSGNFKKYDVGERFFKDEEPINARREAIKFANNLYEVIKEAEPDIDFNPRIPIIVGRDEAGLSLTVSVVFDDGDDLIIYGSFLENMLESWDEEVQIYIDNGYYCGAKLYSVNASKYHLGYVTVFKDDYDAYDLQNLGDEENE
jgi:hypothetical protein